MYVTQGLRPTSQTLLCDLPERQQMGNTLSTAFVIFEEVLSLRTTEALLFF